MASSSSVGTGGVTGVARLRGLVLMPPPPQSARRRRPEAVPVQSCEPCAAFDHHSRWRPAAIAPPHVLPLRHQAIPMAIDDLAAAATGPLAPVLSDDSAAVADQHLWTHPMTDICFHRLAIRTHRKNSIWPPGWNGRFGEASTLLAEGDRQANATLHRIVVVRLRWHEQTKVYAARRLKEERSKAEIMRCLKCFIAREVFHTLLARCEPPPLEPFRSARLPPG